MGKCVVCGKPVGKGVKYCATCGASGAGKARQPSGGSGGALSTGEWLVTLIVIAIPLVGLIITFVWAFGSGNASRRNFCRAGLILMAAAIILSLIFGVFARSLYQGIFNAFYGLMY